MNTNIPGFEQAFQHQVFSLFRTLPDNPSARKNAEFLATLRALEFLERRGLWSGDKLETARQITGTQLRTEV